MHDIVKTKPTVTILKKQTLLGMIEGSEGSKMFRHLYAEVGDEERDILRDGQVACAYYVSTILSMPNFGLLKAPHATVEGLIRGLEAAGWVEASTPSCRGDVIVWERAAQAGGEKHLHAGFYLGGEEAMSHVDETRTPKRHDVTFGQFEGTPVRKIVAIYTHASLQ